MSETDSKKKIDKMKRPNRLRKRLLYVLRYGVLKEGLETDQTGFVNFLEVMKVPLLKCYSQEEVMNEIKTSISFRGQNRYDWREIKNKIQVRAAYLRHFEQNPYHTGTKVKTLLEGSMSTVLENLEMFDLEDFPDEFLANKMIHRLKRKKAVTNKALATLFIPTLTKVNLHGVFLTNNTLRLLWTQCPHLKDLNLNNSGYIITDTILTQIVKNLPKLEILNLTRCSHLTNKCLPVLSKRLPNLKSLYLAGVPSITPQAIQVFLEDSKNIKLLDVYFMKSTAEEFKLLKQFATKHCVDLMLQPPGTDGAEDMCELEEEEEDLSVYEDNHEDDDVDDDENDNDDNDDDDYSTEDDDRCDDDQLFDW